MTETKTEEREKLPFIDLFPGDPYEDTPMNLQQRLELFDRCTKRMDKTNQTEDDRVEEVIDNLFRLANGHFINEVVMIGRNPEVLTKYIPPNFQAIKFILQNRTSDWSNASSDETEKVTIVGFKSPRKSTPSSIPINS